MIVKEYVILKPVCVFLLPSAAGEWNNVEIRVDRFWRCVCVCVNTCTGCVQRVAFVNILMLIRKWYCDMHH